MTDLESDPAVQTFSKLLKERFEQGFAAGKASGIRQGRVVGAEEVLTMLPGRLTTFIAELLAELGAEPVEEPEAAQVLSPETSIDALHLPERPYLALRRYGVHTIGAATRIRSSQLQHIRNLGPKGLQQLDAALQKVGYSRVHPVPLITCNALQDPDDSLPELQYSLKRIGLNGQVRKALERHWLKTVNDVMGLSPVDLIGMLHKELPERLRLLDERLAHYGLHRRRDVALEAAHGYVVEFEQQ